MKKTLVLTAFLATLCWSSASASVTKQRFPAAFALTQSECPELAADVTGSGEASLIARVTLDGNGAFHLGGSFSAQGTATDSEGRNYRFSDTDGFSFNGRIVGDPNTGEAAPPFEITLTESFHLVGQGGAPNVTVRAVLHVKVLGDGTVTAFVAQAHGSEACAGL